MNFDFLTPEIFDMLVIANLVLALVLIAGRFYYDMTRQQPEPNQHREQAHDESSYAHLSDTDNAHSEQIQDTSTQKKQANK